MMQRLHYDADGKLLIGKSMLESFLFCPVQFYRQYMIGRGDIEVAPKQHMVIGTRFHEYATRFFDYYAMVPQTLEGWKLTIPDSFNDAERDMATWWLEYQWDRLQHLESENRIDEWFPIAREQTMVNDTLRLRSTVDAVEWWDRSKDQACIVEYKTGRRMNVESAVRQCVFYALLWDANGNMGNATHVKLVNPRLHQYAYYQITTADIEKVLRSIIKLRTAIDTSTFKPNCTEGRYAVCRLCDPNDVKIFPKGHPWREEPFKQEVEQ